MHEIEIYKQILIHIAVADMFLACSSPILPDTCTCFSDTCTDTYATQPAMPYTGIP